MSRSKILDEIINVLAGKERPDDVFFFNGSYKIVADGDLVEIQTDRAVSFMLAGSRLVYVVEDTRRWDDGSGTFAGPEPQHPVPADVPPDTNILNITCCFSPEVMAEVFTGRRLSRG